MKTYDILVLGGGTAGSAAARAAHEAGAKVAMFNDGELGGLCILRGCMPTKTMLHSAHLLHHARHHHTPGVGTAQLQHDFTAIMGNKDSKVARFQRAKVQSIQQGGFELIDARARFVGPDEVEAGGERYRFTKGAVIASGSVQRIPDLPGLDTIRYWTSDDLMQITSAPASILVLGSGPVGLEFAQFFARLGTDAQLVTRRRIFADVDPLMSDEFEAAARDEPRFTLHDRTTPVSVERVEGGVVLHAEHDGKPLTLRAERLVLATGREANVANLGLEAAGVEMDGPRVRCDEAMRTTNPKVFVAGDATGHRLLLHVANWEGRAAGLGAVGAPMDQAVDERLHTEVIFYDPCLATVGYTELQAQQMGFDVVCAAVRIAETGRAITMDVKHGAMKLVARRDNGEILGAQLLMPRADDLIHIVGAVIGLRGTAAQMTALPWYHPTLAEVFLSLARDIESQRATN